MNNSENGKNKNKQTVSASTRTVAIFAACVCGILLLSQIEPIKAVFSWVVDALSPVILGVVLAYIVSPFTSALERFFYRSFKLKKESSRKRLARGLSVTSSVIALLLVIVLLIFLIIPEFLESLNKLINNAPDYYKHAVDWVDDIKNSDNELVKNISEYLNTALESGFNWISGELGTAVSGIIDSLIVVVSFMFDFLVALVVFVYALLEKHKFIAQIKKFIFAVFKPSRANDILHVARYSNDVFGKFITGKLLTSSIVGIVTFLFMSIMGMPYALLSAGIIAITNVIPFFGPFIGGIPTALIVLISDVQDGIIYVIFLVALQQIEGNIIEPMIMSDKTGLSKFWIIFALMLCGGVFGIAGMIFAVPFFAVLFYSIKIAVDRSLAKKNLPISAMNYSNAGGIDPDNNEIIPVPDKAGHKKFKDALDEWGARIRKNKNDDDKNDKK